MEATAFIEEVRKTGSNTFDVTISVSISSFHLKLMKKNDGKTMHGKKERYSFVLTVFPHKFHMAPNDVLGECMEIRDNNDSCKGLTPFQQKQWCVGELTHRVVRNIISTELTEPIFLVDIPLSDSDDKFPAEVDEETVSPFSAVRDRLQELEDSIESLINLLDGMRAVSDIEEDTSEDLFNELRKLSMDENVRRITLD